jgi:diguanylate cyclase (GGDEF)-like protein
MVLRAVGKTLAATARRSDICARWGGEEFIIVLAQTDFASGLVAAERIRKLIEGLDVVSDKGHAIAVTASIGVTSLYASDTLESFLERADRAMYVAKSTGRNRVCTVDIPDIEPIPMSQEGANTNISHVA